MCRRLIHSAPSKMRRILWPAPWPFLLASFGNEANQSPSLSSSLGQRGVLTPSLSLLALEFEAFLFI